MHPRSDQTAQRLVDVAVSAALLIVLAPVIAVLALVSAAAYRSWPIFLHDRVGRDGTVFRFAKIRTLPPRTEAYTEKYRLEPHDLPSPMRLMRLTHLDELPQLWHVLRGQMSMVGPRPEMPHLHAQLPPMVADERTTVRPGVTGLWQVGPHCMQMIGERPEYDRLYVRHHNLLLDGWIVVATIRKIVLRRTTPLYEVPMWTLGPAGSMQTDERSERTPVTLGVVD